MKSKAFTAVLQELNWPELYLVTPKQFAKLPGGWDIGNDAGGAIEDQGVITVNRGFRGKARLNTIWHEIFHVLYPKWPEWKCYFVGFRMAGGGGTGGESCTQGHTLDEIPSRATLLRMARRQVERYRK